MNLDDFLEWSTNKFTIVGSQIRYIESVEKKNHWRSPGVYYLRINTINPKTLRHHSTTSHSNLSSYDVPFYLLDIDQINADSYREVYEGHSKLNKTKQAYLDKLPNPILFNNRQGLKL